MARTATNVVGAATATTLVAATEEQLDTAVYNGTVETLAAEAWEWHQKNCLPQKYNLKREIKKSTGLHMEKRIGAFS